MTWISAKVFFWVALTFSECTGKTAYEAEFSDDLISCKGFQNEDIECNNFKCGVIHGNDDESSSIGLSGDLEIHRSLDEGYFMNIEVWKLLEIGKEFTFDTMADICKSVKRDDTPWYPLVVMMNITDCPIPAYDFLRKIYTLSNLILSLDFAKNVLCLELCGEYEVSISVLDEKEKQISCHVLGISVVEVEMDD